MKKLEKLLINSGKLMDADELIKLRGGGTCAATCEMPDGGTIRGVSRSTAEAYARECNSIGGSGWWCCDSCDEASWY